MSEAPTMEEFILHMQAELDTCEEITDAVERQHKQWQLETSIQQAVLFSNRFKELLRIGKDPLKIVEALSMPDGPSAEEAKQAIAKVGGFCSSCGSTMQDDLDFCANCGEYTE
jgi:hypothetical protein